MRRAPVLLLLLAACSSEARPSGGGAADAEGVDVGSADAGSADAAAVDADDGVDAESIDATCAGPDCEFNEDTTATCTDGLDNDEDGYFDCKDFDCRPVNPCNIPEDSFEACTDRMDNDGDGYFDCKDFGCRRSSPCNIDESSSAGCTDTFDNDGDNFTDCADSECALVPECSPTEDVNATCRDMRDNDGDMSTDCADPSCAAASVCSPIEDSDATCSDGADNDGDMFTDCADDGCTGAGPCNPDAVRVAAYNVQTLGGAGSSEHVAARAIAERVGAHILCFEEIEAWEGSRLAAFAAGLGYPHVFQGGVSSAMAGGLTNACISKYPIVEGRSLSSDDITGISTVNETGRDFAMVRVEIIPGMRYLAVFAAHLKSGFQDADYFRRQIEIVRLAQAVTAHSANYPNDAIVVLGDFNEELGESTIGRQFPRAPSGLPSSYSLGGDITFPVTYDPFSPLVAVGLEISDPTHEDSTTNRATRIPSGRRIDYLLYSGSVLAGDEVYNPCADNGVDDPPAGNWMPLYGSPLPCSEKEVASDHRLVFIDLTF